MQTIFSYLFRGLKCSGMLIYFLPTAQHVVHSQVDHTVVQRIVQERIRQLSHAKFAEILLDVRVVMILHQPKYLRSCGLIISFFIIDHYFNRSEQNLFIFVFVAQMTLFLECVIIFF